MDRRGIPCYFVIPSFDWTNHLTMLRLFRTLRQRLLTENRVSKYLPLLFDRKL